jgi:ribosomal-protein-alanine N-acetyltransferase
MVALDDVCFEASFRFSRSSMRRFAEAKKARVVVAEEDGELAGFCIVHVERGVPRVGYLVTLDVAVTFRRRGLASRMMAEVERLALEAGCELLGLHVWTENVAAVRFYERLGFAYSRIEGGFYGDGRDALVLVKPLV